MPVSRELTLVADTPAALDLGEGARSAYFFEVTTDGTAAVDFLVGIVARTAGGTADFTATGDTWTSTAHGLAVDDLVFFTASDTNPTEYALETPYYVVSVADANTFQLSATKGGAVLVGTVNSGASWTYEIAVVAPGNDDQWKLPAVANASRAIPANGNVQGIVAVSAGTPTLTVTALESHSSGLNI